MTGLIVVHLVDGTAVRSRPGPDVDTVWLRANRLLTAVTPNGQPAYGVVAIDLAGHPANRAIIPTPSIRWIEQITTEES